MRYIGSFLVLLLLTSPVWAQQRPQYTQYMVNNYLLNPAISGMEDYTDVKIGTRQQWVGLEGAPTTFHVSAHTPIGKSPGLVRAARGGTRTVNRNRFTPAYPHHGVGIMVISDQAGSLRRTNVAGSYAYHLPITSTITMSMGAYGGILRNSFLPSKATFNTPGDPLVVNDNINRTLIDIGVGLWVYSRDFFAGASIAQLLRTDLSENENRVTQGILQKHYYATGGYKFRVSPEVTLVPSILVKYSPPSPNTYDFNLRAVYAERVWIGSSFRTRDAFALMAGANISYLLDVSYAYDYNTSNLNVANSGTHEVVVGLKLFNKAKTICPRWMQ